LAPIETFKKYDCCQTAVMKIHVQKRKSHFGRYFSLSLTVPKEIISEAKWIRKQRVVRIEVDRLLGHIIIKP